MPEPPRRETAYRQYSESDVTRIRFIKRAQTLGFTLKEILDLLSLRVDPTTTCGDVKSRGQDCRHAGEDLRSPEDEKGPDEVDGLLQRTGSNERVSHSGDARFRRFLTE